MTSWEGAVLVVFEEVKDRKREQLCHYTNVVAVIEDIEQMYAFAVTRKAKKKRKIKGCCADQAHA
jgi:hypothetical protein